MKIKICPKCKNTKIKDVTETESGELMYFPYGSPRLYKCTKCGFTNAIFSEIEKKELKLNTKFNPVLMKFEPDLEKFPLKKKNKRK